MADEESSPFDELYKKTWRIKDPSCIFCVHYRASSTFFGYCMREGVVLLQDMAQICKGYSKIPQFGMVGALTSPPQDKAVNKKEVTYNADKNVETIVFKDKADVVLFTLTLSYDADKNIIKIERS